MKNNILKNLILCLNYMEKTRGTWHTTTVINGIDNNRENIVIVGSHQELDRFTKMLPHESKNYYIAIDSEYMEDRLRGKRCPMVFDNYALNVIWENLRAADSLIGKLSDLFN